MKQEDKAGKISFKTKGDALRCTGSCDLLDSWQNELFNIQLVLDF